MRSASRRNTRESRRLAATCSSPRANPCARGSSAGADRPVDRAIRLLCLEDPVTLPEAESALGDIRPSELLAAGLLERDGDQVASRLRLRAHDGLFFFADHLRHGGEAVMGAGPLTGLLLAAAMPGRPIHRALDLGCGAGVVALALARHAGSVVATDINPRALVLARVNAALNGIANIDFRTGDSSTSRPRRAVRPHRLPTAVLPGPSRVCGQHVFPWRPQGRRDPAASARGGAGSPRAGRALRERRGVARGGRRAARGAPPRGRFGGGEPPPFQVEGPDIDAFCIGDTAFSLIRHFGRAYAEAVVAQREHMEALSGSAGSARRWRSRGAGRLGIRGGSCEHGGGRARRGVDWHVRGRGFAGSGVDATLIDRLMEARGVAHRGRDALLAARLRLREGTAFASGKEPLLRVLFERGGPLSEIRLDRAAQRILEMVDASPSVQAAAKRFVKESSGPRGAATDRFCVRRWSRRSSRILEVVPAG